LNQDVTDCPRCCRRTPAARGECIYCGESLPSTKIEAAPPQRNIDTTENAFNTVLEPPPAVIDEGAVAALAAAIRLELAEAQALIAAGKPIPLARSQTRAEAEMIAELVRTCGFRVVVIADEELSPRRELVRARRLELGDDEIQVHYFGGAFGLKKTEAKLLVVGELSNTRVDYTEGISGGRGQSGSVLDTSEYRSGETLLDVYAANLDKSFRIKSDAFDYSGLVSPLSFRSDVNFQAAVVTLRAALPQTNFDDDFKAIRNLLGRAWPERTRNETRGFKRTGLAFRAVAQASVLSGNRDQFERYSRLMFLSIGIQV
jgi:hypothetical protein